MTRWTCLVWLAALLATTGCDGANGTDAAGAGTPAADAEVAEVAEPQLQRELVEMFDADQAERTGESDLNGDQARADRLREIIDEHGWPTFDLVGVDGATAAWVIAQHADFDVELQTEALELMRPAVEAGQADPTELAYLEDRVAVNSGEPQMYGTQVRCGRDGVVPATRIAEEEQVDQRRAGAGMEPLADYYAQMEEGCDLGG